MACARRAHVRCAEPHYACVVTEIRGVLCRYGVGMSLYFKFLKLMSVVFCLVSLAALVPMAYYFSSSATSSDERAALMEIDRNLWVFLNNIFCWHGVVCDMVSGYDAARDGTTVCESVAAWCCFYRLSSYKVRCFLYEHGIPRGPVVRLRRCRGRRKGRSPLPRRRHPAALGSVRTCLTRALQPNAGTFTEATLVASTMLRSNNVSL